jgi:DNA-directed RNA polymerase specialized sigma24 family protein
VLARTIDDEPYERLALALGATPKAASNVAYRARRKLAAALPHAA